MVGELAASFAGSVIKEFITKPPAGGGPVGGPVKPGPARNVARLKGSPQAKQAKPIEDPTARGDEPGSGGATIIIPKKKKRLDLSGTTGASGSLGGD
jgi:hypothetical protein